MTQGAQNYKFLLTKIVAAIAGSLIIGLGRRGNYLSATL